MTYFTLEFLLWAAALGAISAVTLPLGALVGIRTSPSPRLISVLAAFGAGALIAALTVELVAPTLFELEHSKEGHYGSALASFYALVLGAACGGVIFTLLDIAVNSKGGFLRRSSSTIAYLTMRQRKHDMAMISDLSVFPLVKLLPPDHVNSLVRLVRPVTFDAGEIIAQEGNRDAELIFVVEGTIDAHRSDGLASTFGPGDIIGVIPVVMDRPQVATGTARTAIKGYALSREDFRTLKDMSPKFKAAQQELTHERLDMLNSLVTERGAQISGWLQQAGIALRTGAQMPDEMNMRKAVKGPSGAPLAIWLGILLDGIPESIVIGAGLLFLLQGQAGGLEMIRFTQVIPYTLVAGLFLSNFPEALASSANMKLQGFSDSRIFLLWFSLLVVTVIVTAAGFLVAETLSHVWVVFAEGLAAGAMLTMITTAIIPEAVHMGRANEVGLSTLTGFLAAISFKLLG